VAKRKDKFLGRYVISFEVQYPGDFAFAGRFWRALEEVKAENAMEAVQIYQSQGCSCHGDRFMATDFPPAFDVLTFRHSWKILS
jgi:hypothetical protein